MASIKLEISSVTETKRAAWRRISKKILRRFQWHVPLADIMTKLSLIKSINNAQPLKQFDPKFFVLKMKI